MKNVHSRRIVSMFLLVFATVAVPWAHAQKFTVLYNFAGPPDGGVPYASLIEAHGILYGTTYVGGTGPCTIDGQQSGCGTVFKVSGRKEVVLYSFPGAPAGEFPTGGVVRDEKGNLYGTAGGGAFGYGMVFEIRRKKEAILYSFKGTPDGAYPTSTLVRDADGNLYGTTYGGGANGADYGGGTVFKLDPNGNETVLYSFCSGINCSDGEYPVGGLVADANGNLYGTTYYGGTTLGSTNGSGTVFELDTSGHETVLYTFCAALGCIDGANPEGALVMDADGNLYGTTYEGGTPDDAGVVFKLDTTDYETVLYTFCSEEGCADGKSPTAGLITDTKGNFYGAALSGGSGGGGTIFKLDPSGSFTLLHSFTSGGPIEPIGGLVMDAKGNLFGTAAEGGPGNCTLLYYGCGAVFKIKP